VKLFGLQSGKKLREFSGHSRYVNDMFILEADTFIVTGASDGLVKVWDFKSRESLVTIKPPN